MIERKRIPGIVIAGVFLAYGLLRFFVGIGMVGQAIGLVDLADLREPIVDVDRFLGEKNGEAFVAFSSVGYLGYIALMGATLTLGAIGVIWRKAFGLPLVGIFLALWLALFINFQTINQKIVQAAIFAAMYAALVWLETRPRKIS
jgi:hypothetical protein